MITRLLLAAALLVTQPNPVRILFIGNSLTYANDLPAMVCALARSAGRPATCEGVAKPDYGLEEHWNEKEARQAIARGWDVVFASWDSFALVGTMIACVAMGAASIGWVCRSAGDPVAR